MVHARLQRSHRGRLGSGWDISGETPNTVCLPCAHRHGKSQDHCHGRMIISGRAHQVTDNRNTGCVGKTWQRMNLPPESCCSFIFFIINILYRFWFPREWSSEGKACSCRLLGVLLGGRFLSRGFQDAAWLCACAVRPIRCKVVHGGFTKEERVLWWNLCRSWGGAGFLEGSTHRSPSRSEKSAKVDLINWKDSGGSRENCRGRGLRQRLSVDREMAAPGERLRLYCWFPFLPLSFLLWLLAFPQCSCELLDHLILPSLTHSLWSCTLNDCGQELLSPGCGEVKPCVLRVVQMAAAVAGEGRSVRLLTVESRDSGWKSIHHLDILVRCAAVTGHHRLNHYFLSSGRIRCWERLWVF